ncbi:hypothetical protein [Cohnella luojiensis]|uniref:Uncharacterized protein n=1 Tax=Cohnella luojiensis TaxID=652876 RepID=A0A4Y8M048_9BACL|nr:hypothetical protein [Cohnella luojiensis]TFE27812.1 hypothetical protein E2980_08495 [Cohnella luojiensis]
MSESFETSYVSWMDKQKRTSKGERKRRLAEAANHAEKMFIQHVWWPSFRHFSSLQAEFEENSRMAGGILTSLK